MIALIETNRDAIATLCKQYGVTRLAVFGSAVNGTFNPETSDVDFVADMGPYQRGVGMRFLGLIVSLEQLLDRRVDVVTMHQDTSGWFRTEVERTAVTIYEQQCQTVVA